MSDPREALLDALVRAIAPIWDYAYGPTHYGKGHHPELRARLNRAITESGGVVVSAEDARYLADELAPLGHVQGDVGEVVRMFNAALATGARDDE
jgi:hypothetical protein